MGSFCDGSLMMLLHRGKGVPLEGPFLGCFSQGNLTKVNEIALFHRFRIFCNACSVPLGRLGGWCPVIPTLLWTVTIIPFQRYLSVHPIGNFHR